MQDLIDHLWETIHRVQQDRSKASELAALFPQIQSLTDDQVSQFLSELQARHTELNDESFDLSIQSVVSSLVTRAQKTESRLQHPSVLCVRDIYLAAPVSSNLRNYLLAWLSTDAQDESLQVWVDLLCQSPPENRSGIGLAFGPLMNPEMNPPSWVVESLINDCTQHRQLAPAVFDLINYYVRTEQLDEHPAIERADHLTDFLGQLIGQLGRIEEGSASNQTDPHIIGQQVSDSVALIVALCDTLALLDYEPAIGKLNQALNLRHRRIQVEAAAALVRLGDEFGRESLIQLASEPIVRLRVLNYAEELDLLEEISLEQRGEIATAESHLAIWLAEPMQMGIAPSRMELIDTRELNWPSYEHPVVCFIFRFEYGSDENTYSNLAICGPMVHAFTADLKVLPVDDVYALFAGWQTVHDEIFQMTPERAQQAFAAPWKRLVSILVNEDQFSDSEPVMLGSFFGKLVLIAKATQAEIPGTAVVDEDGVVFVPEGTPTAPINPDLAYAIWRGRQLLSTFNPA